MRILSFLLIFCSLFWVAQTQITGFVKLDPAEVSVKANIILLNEKGEIETFAFTNKDGAFALKVNRTGIYKVQITAFNYQEKIVQISITEKDKSQDLGTITIERLREHEIKEVIITRDKPIRVSKDTIEYKAAKFANGTEMNVEDLLKKLPGLKIDSKGNIKFGNKNVSAVLIENDDLFERGYQTLTQNMPANSLDKVQIIKNYSKNKLLKNVESSESVAINITLKDDAKGKWFGSVLLASTSYKENLYQTKFNLMNFSRKKKIYLLYNQNNLGLNEMEGVQYLIEPSSDKNVENIGSNLGTLSLIDLHSKNFRFENKRTNFNNDKLASLNYINNFKKDWKLKFVTIFNDIENNNFTNSLYRFNYDGLAFTNTEINSWKQNQQNIVGKLEVIKEISKTSSIQFYNKASWLKEDNDNTFIFNENTNFQNGENKLFSSENKIVYTKKLDSATAIVGIGKFIYQNRPYFFTDENNVFAELLGNPSAVKSVQNIDSKLYFGGGKLSYLKTYNEENALEVQAGNESKSETLFSNIKVFDAAQNELSFDKNNYQNEIQFFQNSTFANASYSKKFKKWKLNGALKTELISTEFNTEKNAFFNLEPNISIGFENKKYGNFNLNGSKNFSQSNMEELLLNYIYQGNRNFYKSGLGVQNRAAYNVGFTYNLGNDFLAKSFNFNFNYSKNNDYLSTNILVNPNYNFVQNILVKNSSTLFANLEFKRYLKFVKSRISLLGNYNLSDYENSVNNQPLIQTKFSNYKVGFEMKSGWTKKINYELGYDWTFNYIKSTVNNNDYLDQKAFLNLYYNFSSQFILESKYEYYHFGNASQRSTQFWDMKANYISKRYKMNLFLKANNILNNNSIQQYSIDNISESLYTQKLLPFHLVLGLNKNF